MKQRQRELDPSLAASVIAEDDNLQWGASWIVGQQASLGEFAERVERLIQALRQLHPMFKELYLIGTSKKDSPELAADLSNLRPWVFARSWGKPVPTNAPYSHYNAQGLLTAESKGDMGFSVCLGNLRPPGYEVWIRVGDGRDTGGGINIALPHTVGDDIFSLDFFKSLLTVINGSWRVRNALCSSRNWRELLGEFEPAYWHALPIGGITYSADGTIVEGLPAGTRWEAFGNGGVIFHITDRPDRLDPEHLRQAKAIRDSLAAHGLLDISHAAR
jgi:hypothetical protein